MNLLFMANQLFRGAVDIIDLLSATGQTFIGKKGIIACQLGSTATSDVNDPTLTEYGLSFDGGDYVLCGRPAALEISRPFCIYAVVYINQSGNFECFASKNNSGGSGAGNKGFMFLKGSTNLVQFQAFSDSGTLTPVYSVGAVAAGWHYLYAGWDGLNINIKVDRLETRQAALASYVADSVNQLTLGKYAYTTSNLFTGQEAMVILCSVFHGPAEEQRNYLKLKSWVSARGIAI